MGKHEHCEQISDILPGDRSKILRVCTHFTNQRRTPMTRPPKDDEREERIDMEIIVDAYSAEEQALGWYYYLEEHLHFPFKARCIEHRIISPLELGDEVEVVGMPS